MMTNGKLSKSNPTSTKSKLRLALIVSGLYLPFAGFTIYAAFFSNLRNEHIWLHFLIVAIMIFMPLFLFKLNKLLAITLSLIALSGYLFLIDIPIHEHWCFPPADLINHSLSYELVFPNDSNSKQGSIMAAAMYKYSCEDEFHLPQILLATLFPQIRQNWHDKKIAEIEHLAIQSYQKEIRVFFDDDNLGAIFVNREK